MLQEEDVIFFKQILHVRHKRTSHENNYLTTIIKTNRILTTHSKVSGLEGKD